MTREPFPSPLRGGVGAGVAKSKLSPSRDKLEGRYSALFSEPITQPHHPHPLSLPARGREDSAPYSAHDPLPSLRSPGMTPSFTRSVRPSVSFPAGAEGRGRESTTTVTEGTSGSLPLVGRARVGV